MPVRLIMLVEDCKIATDIVGATIKKGAYIQDFKEVNPIEHKYTRMLREQKEEKTKEKAKEKAKKKAIDKMLSKITVKKPPVKAKQPPKITVKKQRVIKPPNPTDTSADIPGLPSAGTTSSSIPRDTAPKKQYFRIADERAQTPFGPFTDEHRVFNYILRVRKKESMEGFRARLINLDVTSREKIDATLAACKDKGLIVIEDNPD